MPARPNAFGPALHNPGPYAHAGGGGGAGGGGHAHQMHGHMLQQHDRYQAAAHAHAQAQVQAQVQAQQAQQRQKAAEAAAAVAAAQHQAAQHAQQLAQQQQQQQQQLLQQRGSMSTTSSALLSATGGGMLGTMGNAAPAAERMIVNVWQGNLEQEVAKLRDLVDRYKYIAMDTEFPGIVARPIGSFKNKADYHYQTLRCNVDLLKIIQLGITISDDEGEMPEVCTWQFNFKFDLQQDMYAQDSIKLLSDSGLDFTRHTAEGINVHKFGELLISSGLVLLDDVKWTSFHSAYDFGYLVKIMMCRPLPAEEAEFRLWLSKFFPSLYDIKFLMKSCKGLKGGLQEIANDLSIDRIGLPHQAGSDSMLTAHIFFEIKRVFFDNKMDDEKYLGQVWGLNGLGQTNGIGGGVIYNAGGPMADNGKGGIGSTDKGKEKEGGVNPPSTPPNASSNTNGNPSTPAPQQIHGPSTPSYTPGPQGRDPPQSVFQFGKMGGN